MSVGAVSNEISYHDGHIVSWLIYSYTSHFAHHFFQENSELSPAIHMTQFLPMTQRQSYSKLHTYLIMTEMLQVNQLQQQTKV